MSENIEKRIKTVRTLFLILIAIVILGGLGLYDSYKEHNDLFVFSSIGLLTFVAIFYNMVYSTYFIRVSDLVTKSIDKKVESKKKILIQLAKGDNFKKLREESTKI